jgi:hypothetical protein
VDRNGRSVAVGTRVRVLGIAPSVTKNLPADERQELIAMVGATFRVVDVDEHGAAWVHTRLVRKADGYRYSHGLGLDPHEMEVAPLKRRPTTR